MSEPRLSDIVRARWLEAADTDNRWPDAKSRPSTKSGLWPAYQYTFEDQAHWGQARLAEEREMRFKRLPTSSAANQRLLEVMDWNCKYIDTPEARQLVWGWAFCKVNGRSFSRFVKDSTEMSRATAYRLLDETFEEIAVKAGRGVILRSYPAEIWVRQIMGDQPIDSPTLDELPTSPTSWSAPGEQPSDLPENRDFSWADKQAERHAKREAKRRKLLGVEG